MAKNFEQLLILAQGKGPKRLSVAVAEDKGVLSAIKIAKDRGIIKPVLVGNEEKITFIAKEVRLNLDDVKIIHEEDVIKAARIATELVAKKEADVLMKGLIDTSIIMKQVLDKEIGLRGENVISHIALFEVSTYHKLFMVTDAAMNIAPNLAEKKEIIENAVNMALSIDINMPKVAVLAAKEKVSPKMEATIDAQKLKSMNKDGIIKNCIVDGPFALDNAISEESAKIKGIESEVAGDADILVVPDIEAGNVLYKSLTFLANAKSAGLIVGARAPIVLTSRADNEEAKLNSIALATLMASMGGDYA